MAGTFSSVVAVVVAVCRKMSFNVIITMAYALCYSPNIPAHLSSGGWRQAECSYPCSLCPTVLPEVASASIQSAYSLEMFRCEVRADGRDLGCAEFSTQTLETPNLRFRPLLRISLQSRYMPKITSHRSHLPNPGAKASGKKQRGMMTRQVGNGASRMGSRW